jgi:uncharacterized protein
MKVQIEKSYPMPGSAEAAWAVLRDIDRVASCMPGAKITEHLGDNRYKGTVAVKFGPANMSFRGDVHVSQLDEATRTMRLVGKGTDTTGSSGAAMDLEARVEAVDSAACNLVGKSEVSMSGKAATFGGRMAGAVADQVLKQFSANFAAQVQAMQAAIGAPAAPAAAAEPAAAQPGVALTAAVTAVQPGAPGSAAPSAAAPATPSAAIPPPPAPAASLNALALVWAMIKDWLRSLFGGRKA